MRGYRKVRKGEGDYCIHYEYISISIHIQGIYLHYAYITISSNLTMIRLRGDETVINDG